MKLTRKEQKLMWLIRHKRKHNLRLTIGDECRILHTTVFTLLGKTYPNLMDKIESRTKEALEELKQEVIALNSCLYSIENVPMRNENWWKKLESWKPKTALRHTACEEKKESLACKGFEKGSGGLCINYIGCRQVNATCADECAYQGEKY